MSRPGLHTFAGCVVSLALGVAAGWLSHRPARSGADPHPRPVPTSPRLAAPRPGRTVSNALAESLRNGTGAQRWLVMLATLENARAEDIPALLRLVRNDPAMVRVLAMRWAEIDPGYMFYSLFADSILPRDAPDALPERWMLRDVLFEQWTKQDLAGAIKALNDVPEFAGRFNWRLGAFEAALNVDVERALPLMRDWDILHYTPDLKHVGEWAARDPRHAAEVVAQVSSGDTSHELLKEVGKAWAQSDPEGGVRFAATMPAGLRSALGGEIVRRWAEKNLAAAVALVGAQSDPAFQAAIAPGLLEVWGRTDAAAALAWSQQALSGMARNEAVASLIAGAAEKDLAAAGELVAGMAPGSAQNRACASLFETWFKKGADQRDEAIAWLAGLPDPDAQRQALERVQWEWLFKDPESTRDFVSGPYGYLASASLLDRVAFNQTVQNPEAALEWADRLPADRAGRAHRAVFSSWLNTRPEGAATYALGLPAGADREQAIRTVSKAMVHSTPRQAAEWYRQLSGQERTAARDIINRSSLNEDRKKQLNTALDGG